MGVVHNIDHTRFPEQDILLNKRVVVFFHYDLNNKVYGKIVRSDAEQPGRTIIELDDGRYILSTECHFTLMPSFSREEE